MYVAKKTVKNRISFSSTLAKLKFFMYIFIKKNSFATEKHWKTEIMGYMRIVAPSIG